MQKLKLYIIGFGLTLFSGCSWNQYFIVKNFSNSEAVISYSVKASKSGEFAIFNLNPEFYQMTKSGIKDWKKKIELVDQDTSYFNLSFKLPPNSLMVFGTLNNDTYQSNDQNFINSRKFNFEMMEIEDREKLVRIIRSSFDNYFKKCKVNEICYEIK